MEPEYAIVSGKDTDVEHNVNAMFKKGWRLYGPLTMGVDSETQTIICAQAMVKGNISGEPTSTVLSNINKET